jgi:hypothetical protein
MAAIVVRSTMRMQTVLVGTDLTERCDQAILRGHHIASANEAKLVVCHVGPGHVGSHPLFPQRHQDDLVSASNLEERIAEAVSLRAAEVTGRNPDQFDVVIARTSPCSVFVVGEGSGTGVAVVALEDEVEVIPELVSAARGVLAWLPSRIDVILFADDPKLSPSRTTLQIADQAATLGVALVPWFAEIGDTALLTRAVDDPSLGLVVMAAPLPDDVAAATSGPLDDALSTIRSSILLLRT